jgi:hypothetical protein
LFGVRGNCEVKGIPEQALKHFKNRTGSVSINLGVGIPVVVQLREWLLKKVSALIRICVLRRVEISIADSK